MNLLEHVRFLSFLVLFFTTNQMAFASCFQSYNSQSTYLEKVLVAWHKNVIFNLDENCTPDDRATSFAHWIEVYIDYGAQRGLNNAFEQSKAILNHYGIDTYRLLQATGFAADSAGFFKFYNHCIFYTETDKAFQQRLGAFLQENTDNVRMKMLDNEPGPLRFWVETTAKKNVYVLVVSNSGKTDLSLRSEIQKEDEWTSPTKSILRKKNGFLGWKRKLKFVVPALTSRMTQEVSTNYLQIALSATDQSWRGFATMVSNRQFKAKPYIDQFYINEENPIEGTRLSLTWEILGAKEVFLGGGIGVKPPKGQIMIAPMESTDYTLRATNEEGEVRDSIHLNVERVYLSKAVLTLFTPTEGDPKLPSSTVDVKLFNLRDEVAASIACGQNIEFSGKLTNYFGPFELNMPTPVYKRDLIRGHFDISISGTLPDSWTMSPILVLSFTDGTEKKYFGYGNKVLNANGESWVIKF